ncbi:MAG: hypothetical protein M0C28_48950 [Candidatus Moduliflexus flocculans]|nr:hypothetical protein [Candidatus Moduliflexus flocculans]
MLGLLMLPMVSLMSLMAQTTTPPPQTFSATVYFDYRTFLTNDGPVTLKPAAPTTAYKSNAFLFRRAYFTYENKINDNLKFRFRHRRRQHLQRHRGDPDRLARDRRHHEHGRQAPALHEAPLPRVRELPRPQDGPQRRHDRDPDLQAGRGALGLPERRQDAPRRLPGHHQEGHH